MLQTIRIVIKHYGGDDTVLDWLDGQRLGLDGLSGEKAIKMLDNDVDGSWTNTSLTSLGDSMLVCYIFQREVTTE